MTNSIRTRLGVALAVGALVALSACGSSADEPGPDAELQAQQAQEQAENGAADAPPADESSNEADATNDETTSDTVAASAIENSPSLAVTGDALPELADPNNDPAVGLTAPVIDGVTFDGSGVIVGGPTDGPTMLVFLAHWCPHCNDEIPELLALRESGDLPDDLNIIGVSTAVQPDRDNFPPSSWVVDKGWAWPVLADTADSQAIQLYGGSGFPFTVMLNADGTVNARKSGTASADEIRDWIDTTLLR